MTSDPPPAERQVPDLSDVFAEALSQLGPSEPRDVDEHLALVQSVAQLEAQGRLLLRDTVRSARASGATWAAIGHTLGMSKQAAQKRFGAEPADPAALLDPDERILGPVTAFDEMRELELAGRYGWHSVDFGPHHHRVVHSQTQWEHQRVTLLRNRTRAQLLSEGWQVVRSEFPYTYLKRDLGIPALVEPGPAPRTSAQTLDPVPALSGETSES